MKGTECPLGLSIPRTKVGPASSWGFRTHHGSSLSSVSGPSCLQKFSKQNGRKRHLLCTWRGTLLWFTMEGGLELEVGQEGVMWDTKDSFSTYCNNLPSSSSELFDLSQMLCMDAVEHFLNRNRFILYLKWLALLFRVTEQETKAIRKSLGMFSLHSP